MISDAFTCRRHFYQNKKARPKVTLGRAVVEVTGFEPATFWSRIPRLNPNAATRIRFRGLRTSSFRIKPAESTGFHA